MNNLVLVIIAFAGVILGGLTTWLFLKRKTTVAKIEGKIAIEKSKSNDKDRDKIETEIKEQIKENNKLIDKLRKKLK